MENLLTDKKSSTFRQIGHCFHFSEVQKKQYLAEVSSTKPVQEKSIPQKLI